jgi:hypothetical protein
MNFQGSTEALSHLSYLIGVLDNQDYCRPIKALSDSSIGQHCRHIIEFFQCLLDGADSGIVNYEKRKRNKMIESDRNYALFCLEKINYEMLSKDFLKNLLLEIDNDEENQDGEFVQTTFGREVSYNIEHTVHHLAIIKIGVNIILPGLDLPENFGVASSTVRFQKKTLNQL